jgi:hypothetical protein
VDMLADEFQPVRIIGGWALGEVGACSFHTLGSKYDSLSRLYR